MEDMMFNVLWIDDEHEDLLPTKGRAKRNGINLISYKSLDGIDELEKNYSIYDGVLLDAKFFEAEDDSSGTEDTFNVHRAKERILQLPKKFDIFVLTGQAEAYEDETFNKSFLKVYEKAKNSDIERLFQDIKESALKQADTQIRLKHKRVFDVCCERYVGDLAGRDLLSLLKAEETGMLSDSFNTIRKVVEDLFVAFNKYELLPSEFVNPNVSINESSKFLAGKKYNGEYLIEKGYKHLDETHLPTHIADDIRSILSKTQSGSHRSEIDEHVKTMQTPYVVNGLTNQLMNVITWFKTYVDSDPIKENWEYTVDVRENNNQLEQTGIGKVINYNINRGFAFFKPNQGGENTIIPPHVVTNNNLNLEDEIEVEIESYTDNRSGEERTRVKTVIRKLS